MVQKTMNEVNVKDIIVANQVLKDIVPKTPLEKNEFLSQRYDCNVYVKREDLQLVRSFKIRGAFNLVQSLSEEERENGVVCASAGNHAQGVAFSCKTMEINGKVFMPTTTPKQKVSQVKLFGGDFVEIILIGDTFDDALDAANKYCKENKMTFVHPFDDPRIIAGQGTVAVEIINEMHEDIDYVFVGIGGGGLAAGLATYVKNISNKTKIIGVEPEGAPSMRESIKHNKIIPLEDIDTFIDGAAVREIGDLTFNICKDLLDDIVLVPEGEVCSTILELYNKNAIVAEPSGALSISALDSYKEEIKGKTVVCVISGGNNDIERMQEIKERSLIYEQKKHYFIVNFPQRAGALKEFITMVVGEKDDITRFEYTKKNNRETGPVLIGIELMNKEDYLPLINRMNHYGYSFIEVNKDSQLFNLLI